MPKNKTIGWEEEIKEDINLWRPFFNRNVKGIKITDEDVRELIRIFAHHIKKERHDHKILVETIISTKNEEIKKESLRAIEEYAKQVIPAINDKWRKRLEKERLRVIKEVEQIMGDTLSVNTLQYHREVNEMYDKLEKIK